MLPRPLGSACLVLTLALASAAAVLARAPLDLCPAFPASGQVDLARGDLVFSNVSLAPGACSGIADAPSGIVLRTADTLSVPVDARGVVIACAKQPVFLALVDAAAPCRPHDTAVAVESCVSVAAGTCGYLAADPGLDLAVAVFAAPSTDDAASAVASLTASACGDGVLQAGETCEIDHPADCCWSETCTRRDVFPSPGNDTCAAAVCGDGVLHLGSEQCEPSLSDSCTKQCTLIEERDPTLMIVVLSACGLCLCLCVASTRVSSHGFLERAEDSSRRKKRTHDGNGVEMQRPHAPAELPLDHVGGAVGVGGAGASFSTVGPTLREPEDQGQGPPVAKRSRTQYEAETAMQPHPSSPLAESVLSSLSHPASANDVTGGALEVYFDHQHQHQGSVGDSCDTAGVPRTVATDPCVFTEVALPAVLNRGHDGEIVFRRSQRLRWAADQGELGIMWLNRSQEILGFPVPTDASGVPAPASCTLCMTDVDSRAIQVSLGFRERSKSSVKSLMIRLTFTVRYNNVWYQAYRLKPLPPDSAPMSDEALAIQLEYSYCPGTNPAAGRSTSGQSQPPSQLQQQQQHGEQHQQQQKQQPAQGTSSGAAMQQIEMHLQAAEAAAAAAAASPGPGDSIPDSDPSSWNYASPAIGIAVDAGSVSSPSFTGALEIASSPYPSASASSYPLDSPELTQGHAHGVSDVPSASPVVEHFSDADATALYQPHLPTMVTASPQSFDQSPVPTEHSLSSAAASPGFDDGLPQPYKLSYPDLDVYATNALPVADPSIATGYPPLSQPVLPDEAYPWNTSATNSTTDHRPAQDDPSAL